MSRGLFLLVAVALSSLASGCAVDSESGPSLEEEVDELNGDLRHITIVKASVSGAGTIIVAYEPDSGYVLPRSTVPFLAVELAPGDDEAAAEGSAANESAAGLQPMNGPSLPLSVHVAGDFPGSPRVIVTDEGFRALAATRGVPTAAGAEASLQLATKPGRKFVLVRDMLWVRPMHFQVTVGR